jgi:hypothetical protein
MRFLFSTSDKIGAKAIRWGLRSDCSHFAIVFDEDAQGHGIVFHSHMGGVSLDWYSNWLKTNRIVHALEFLNRPPLALEETIYRAIVDRFDGQSYDVGAFSFWAVAVAANRLFGRPLPTKNLWGRSDAALCTGLAVALQGTPIACEALLEVKDFDCIRPYDLYMILKTSPVLKPAGPAMIGS